jgi:hypothetical protein
MVATALAPCPNNSDPKQIRRIPMKLNRILVGSLIALVLTLSVVVFAQVNRPYRNGTVWSIGFIRTVGA